MASSWVGAMVGLSLSGLYYNFYSCPLPSQHVFPQDSTDFKARRIDKLLFSNKYKKKAEAKKEKNAGF